MLNYKKYCEQSSLQEALSYSGGDVTKMPVIGKVLCAEMQWGEHTYPPVEYDIVEIIEDGGRKFYVTNKWHKEGRVPLLIVDELVDTYIPLL